MSACPPINTDETIRLFRKTPNDRHLYGFNFARDLRPGEMLDSVSWVVPGTLTNNGELNDSETAGVDLSGGAVGDPDAVCTCTANTTGAPTPAVFVKTFHMRIVAELGN